jgi:hypothetical protein
VGIVLGLRFTLGPALGRQALGEQLGESLGTSPGEPLGATPGTTLGAPLGIALGRAVCESGGVNLGETVGTPRVLFAVDRLRLMLPLCLWMRL